MSSTPFSRRESSTRSKDASKLAVREGVYNTALAILLGAAVLLFIAGGTTAALQVLWVYALYAVAISAVIFFAHRAMEHRR